MVASSHYPQAEPTAAKQVIKSFLFTTKSGRNKTSRSSCLRGDHFFDLPVSIRNY
jgi:hypothetical protein